MLSARQRDGVHVGLRIVPDKKVLAAGIVSTLEKINEFAQSHSGVAGFVALY